MMRKILALAAFVGLITSCGDNVTIEESKVATGIVMYNSIVGQNYLVMDPTNVAFRLDALITAGAGDPNATSAKMVKESLFDNAEITFDQATSTYTITYPMGYKLSNDVPRVGKMLLNTNGTALGAIGAHWVVKFDQLYYNSGNSISTSLTSYEIDNTGSNSWTINVRDHQTWSDPSFKSTWSCIYSLRQTKGANQTIDVLKESTFMLSFAATNLKTMYTTATYTVEAPIMNFSGKCPKSIIIAGGSMKIKVVGNDTSKGAAEIEWLEGATGCKPKIKLTNNDATEIFE